jgi:tRNA threonylcarbamoyladenosine biosynthesis protein TsaB
VKIAAREHTQHILPMVDAMLNDSDLSVGQLDAIAFNCGPGSFTGLRICLSIAQGLAYGADLPLIAVSSLQAMASKELRLKSLPINTLIIPAIDARMEEVYWSAYKVSSETAIETVIHEQVVSPEQCSQEIMQLSALGDAVELPAGVGSGWHYAELQGIPGLQVDELLYPSAYDVAHLAIDAYSRGELISPQQAQPHYLRNDISWKKRKRIRPQ